MSSHRRLEIFGIGGWEGRTRHTDRRAPSYELLEARGGPSLLLEDFPSRRASGRRSTRGNESI
jgi:hypothetical protein